MQSYDVEKAGSKPEKTAPGQGQVSPKSASGQGGKNRHKASNDKVPSDLDEENVENALFRANKKNGSYRSHDPVLGAEAAD